MLVLGALLWLATPLSLAEAIEAGAPEAYEQAMTIAKAPAAASPEERRLSCGVLSTQVAKRLRDPLDQAALDAATLELHLALKLCGAHPPLPEQIGSLLFARGRLAQAQGRSPLPAFKAARVFTSDARLRFFLAEALATEALACFAAGDDDGGRALLEAAQGEAFEAPTVQAALAQHPTGLDGRARAGILVICLLLGMVAWGRLRRALGLKRRPKGV